MARVKYMLTHKTINSLEELNKSLTILKLKEPQRVLLSYEDEDSKSPAPVEISIDRLNPNASEKMPSTRRQFF